MIVGETVTVRAYESSGEDDFGAEIREWGDEATVPNVLIAPSSTADLTGSTRPDGVSVDLTLHFPRTYTAPLRGRRVMVRGVLYDVVGDPVPYTDANTPTAWDRPVDCTEVDG